MVTYSVGTVASSVAAMLTSYGRHTEQIVGVGRTFATYIAITIPAVVERLFVVRAVVYFFRFLGFPSAVSPMFLPPRRPRGVRRRLGRKL